MGFIRDHDLGGKAKPLFSLQAPGSLFQAAVEQGEGDPAFYRRRLWRNQERFLGRGFLCGIALEDDGKTGQVCLQHGRGTHDKPAAAQHDCV